MVGYLSQLPRPEGMGFRAVKLCEKKTLVDEEITVGEVFLEEEGEKA
jgi:hypothetical protein